MERNRPEVPPGTSRTFGTFRALRHPHYRTLWIGMLASALGTWMQIVAQSLLVLKLTGNSAVALGTVSLAQASAFFLFAPLGGTFADRHDKRKLLFRTQTLLMLIAFALAALTATGIIRLWMVIVLAFGSGTLLSFDQPARASLLPLLAPPEDLINAISLQTLAFNAASIAGPPLGGAVAAAVGLAGDFALNGCSYLAVIVSLFLLPAGVTASHSGSSGPSRTWSAVREMLAVIQKQPAVSAAVLVYAVLLFVAPSQALLVPIFVTSILHGGAAQLGFLFAASGIGTVAGSLFVASFGHYQRKGRLLVSANALWVMALAIFAHTRTFATSFAMLLLMAAAQSVFTTLAITMMQGSVEAKMRGRIMSLNTLLMMGVRPLGDFPVSVATSFFGIANAALLSASVVALAGALVFSLRPAIWRS
ncbi:MAG TPA: MFS transporter [Bryobacteraceae bacterium]|nr:MFS transporter [Bryobacteraceae bacterium]